MGALHEGHAELVRRSLREGLPTVVSIFVNPLQFGPDEDFHRYPRPLETDLKLLEILGTHAVFTPSVEEMYGGGETRLDVGSIGEVWEGAARPGHFNGVATVVAKLFNIVQPAVSYFGWKDFQQCAVLQRMVEDLGFPLRLEFVETIRERDGLALSSRNAYLTADQREIAPQLYETLKETKSNLQSNTIRPVDQFEAILDAARSRLVKLGFKVDYLECVDERTLDATKVYDLNSRLIVAAYIGSTRLIDNLK